jgi:hypothetical protein
MKANNTLIQLAAGPAVYRARDMHALINDTLQYSDSTVCAFEGYYRESTNMLYSALTKKEKHLNYFKAQPNPASEKILFTFGEYESFVYLTIYDISGAIVFSSIKSADMNTLIVNVTNFINGIYIAHFVNNEVSSRIKLAVSK